MYLKSETLFLPGELRVLQRNKEEDEKEEGQRRWWQWYGGGWRRGSI